MNECSKARKIKKTQTAEVALYCTRKKVNNSDAYPKTIKRLYSRISDYEEQQQQQQFTLSINFSNESGCLSFLITFNELVNEIVYEVQVTSALRIMLQRIDQLKSTVEIL
uniref:Uncharacterized protein n=1 Tax=Glossina austeni TaxID=7395 RepID=A0A1A9VY54_GLOAU